MKILYITIIFLFYMSCAYSQVTFGSSNASEDYCLVQIDGDEGGMMLPKLTSTQMLQLKNSSTFVANEKARGLFAYETNTDAIVFWNGTDWIYLGGQSNVGAKNGLTISGTTLDLGGSLDRNTSIDLKDKLLTFSIPSSNTASSISVNTSDLVVSNSTISASPSQGIIFNGLSSLKNNTVSLKLKKMEIKNLASSDPTMRIDKKGLQFGNLNFIPYTSPQASDMLNIDKTTNQLAWSPIRPFSSILQGTMYAGRYLLPGGTTVSSAIKFPPGQYLIITKVNLYQPGGATILYNYIGMITSLSSDFSNPTWTRLSAATPEIKNSETYTTPSFRHYVNFTETTYLKIYCQSSTVNVNTTTGNIVTSVSGAPYVYAIRIDVPVY